MARRCSICARSDAGSINALLLEGRSARSVAAEHGLSEDALQRHAQRHAGRLAAATNVAPALTESGDPLDELVDALRTQALAGNPAIVHQYRLALAAQADVKHAAPPKHDLATEPEWIALRSAMLKALSAHPKARQAVADALAAAGMA